MPESIVSFFVEVPLLVVQREGVGTILTTSQKTYLVLKRTRVLLDWDVRRRFAVPFRMSNRIVADFPASLDTTVQKALRV